MLTKYLLQAKGSRPSYFKSSCDSRKGMQGHPSKTPKSLILLRLFLRHHHHESWFCLGKVYESIKKYKKSMNKSINTFSKV